MRTLTQEPKYSIGQQYKTRGRYPRQCTIVDILRTYNSVGELVQIRYVVEHEFMGQTVRDASVCETTIAMALAD